MPDNEAATAEMPEDFADFEKWRAGEKPEVTPAAEQARTAPDSGTETAQENGEEQTDKTVKGVQKRIDELTKARREAERRADGAERKLATQGSRPATENAQPARPADEGTPKKLDDFETLDQYIDYLAGLKLDQREKLKATETANDAAKTAAKAAQDVWTERETAYKAENPDYDQALESVEIPNTPAVPAIQRALSRAENGPAILHHLAKNPDELQRIAALSPVDALMEIGALKAKLTTAPPPEKPQPKVSSAPKPPARVGGTATSAKAIDDPDLPFEQHEKLMAARDRRRR
jgi:hypothetical protein